MSSIKHGLINAFVSFFTDPAERKAAESIVKKLQDIISDENWFRSGFAERLFAGMKGFLQLFVRSDRIAVAVAADKFNDLLNFVSTDFFRENGQNAARIAEKWLEEHLARVDKQVSAIDGVDELEIREQIVQVVRDAAQEAQSESRRSVEISTDSMLRGWTQSIESLTERINAKRKGGQK